MSQGNGAVERDCCANCRFSVFQIANPQLLDCRKTPPSLFMIPTNRGPTFITEFPKLRRDQWCGEHRKRLPMQEPLPDLQASRMPGAGAGAEDEAAN